MEAQPTIREIPGGICSFCKGEFEKKKMAQHLRYCKPRIAQMKALAADPTEQKARILYIQVEGQSHPQYWMHLELPASEPLDTLDTFLRDMWMQSGGQRSAFRVGETDYQSEWKDEKIEWLINAIRYSGMGDAKEDIIEEEEEEDDNIEDEENMNMQLPAKYMEVLPPDWVAELSKTQPIDDIVSFLKEKQKSLHWNSVPEGRSPELQEARSKLYLQKEALKFLLDQVEDRSMGAQLGRVVKVEQKFYYTYDYNYGSKTKLVLRVVSERDGFIADKEQNVDLLAINVAPVFTCSVCGKPATQMIAHSYDEEEKAYCDTCASDVREKEKEEEKKRRKKKRREEARGIYTINDEIERAVMMPIFNSPRVGIREEVEEDFFY